MSATRKPKYRWSHPREWFDYYLEQETHDRDDLIGIARQLADKLDGDQLQDVFQSDMDADQYFHDWNTCPDCNQPLTTEAGENEAGAYPANYCLDCDREVEVPTT